MTSAEDWEREAENWIAWVRRPGHDAAFRGWCYALNDYWRAFEEAGLLVERLREPTLTLEDPRHDRVPLFLNLRGFKAA